MQSFAIFAVELSHSDRKMSFLAWLLLVQVMGVLDAMPSSNLKPENEDAVRVFTSFCSLLRLFSSFVVEFYC